MPMVFTYALVQESTGQICGIVEATSPESACRAIDYEIGTDSGDYERTAGPTGDGFAVYSVPTGYTPQNGSLTGHPLVGHYRPEYRENFRR